MTSVAQSLGAADPAVPKNTLPAGLSAVNDFLTISNIGDVLAERHGLAFYRLYREMLETCEKELKGIDLPPETRSVLVQRAVTAMLSAFVERYPK
jgi:hypothetical protein